MCYSSRSIRVLDKRWDAVLYKYVSVRLWKHDIDCENVGYGGNK